MYLHCIMYKVQVKFDNCMPRKTYTTQQEYNVYVTSKLQVNVFIHHSLIYNWFML